MIHSIEIHKFKRFEEPIRVEGLVPVNYLVGKNNSGKSSFLQAVLLACLYRTENGSGFNNSSFPENLATYKEYYSDQDISSPIRVVLYDGIQQETIVEGSWINDINGLRKSNKGTGKIPSVLYIPCNVQISKTEDRSTARDVDNQIRELGILPVNSIASLAYHREKNSVGGTWGKQPGDRFSDLRKIVRDEFQIEILAPELTDNNAFDFRYREEEKERSLYLLGSGTQNIIYLAAAIVYLKEYDLMLVDEPELHLHPEIQKKLGGLFRRLSKRFDIQFIIATQSPFLISGLTGDDNIYILRTGIGGTVTKENSFVKVAVSMELGCEPSDVGAPDNFVLVEEASMQAFLRAINDKFYSEKSIQFISCGGINRAPDEETAIQNIVDHNLLMKCTPIYLSKYFVITDKLTEIIRKDKRVLDMQTRLDGRFIEMRFETLEAAYPDKYIEDFIVVNQKVFDGLGGTNAKEKINNWIGEEEQVQGERGKRKYSLAKFVGEVITKEDFKEAFRELLIIFE